MKKGKDIAHRKAIGLQIKQQLREKFITQAAAAQKAGITPEQMGNIISGKTNYTIDSLTQVVEANNLEVRYNLDILENYKLLY